MTEKFLTKDGSENTVPLDIAKKMTAAFRECQTTGKGTYTEAAWFPAGQIAQLAEKVKSFGGDGVRVYFARYTQEIIDAINKLDYGDKIPDSYVDMNTVLFVVTKVINGVPKTDYFTDKLGHGHPHKKGNHPICNPPLPTDPDNRGGLCPNECDGGSPLMN
ncbi:hypothetical protein [Pedobacter sp. Leaf176]|uniref:hypothetical protein n=1 Tax=Pedobacter sp. Leaf176 TaxID=1736286 RepID=UPI0006FE9F87|nr:hypothetical protein [Pedobacter sp. Leaf176]KQR72262.1 hypothetical protein ASF92_02915 [Pedobacter sp. Leaf176]